MPLEEGTKAFQITPIYPELIHEQAKKWYIVGQAATSSSEERLSQAFIACKAREKGTVFPKGRGLFICQNHLQALEPQDCFRFLFLTTQGTSIHRREMEMKEKKKDNSLLKKHACFPDSRPCIALSPFPYTVPVVIVSFQIYLLPLFSSSCFTSLKQLPKPQAEFLRLNL